MIKYWDSIVLYVNISYIIKWDTIVNLFLTCLVKHMQSQTLFDYLLNCASSVDYSIAPPHAGSSHISRPEIA